VSLDHYVGRDILFVLCCSFFVAFESLSQMAPMTRVQLLKSTFAVACFGLCSAIPTIAWAGGEASPNSAQAPHKMTNIFVSGHSLIDDPISGYIAAVAKSLGDPVNWNEQIVIGSPIRVRTKGNDDDPRPWNGYGRGKNRDGKTGYNVLTEWRQPSKYPIDTLIVAEGHKSVSSLIWNDSVRYLRHFHERLIEHNSKGRTYLYEPWESLRDKADPKPWIALERDGTAVWGCVATRINTSLANENRSDRVGTIPVGAALAELIAGLKDGSIPPLTRGAGPTGFDDVISDTVHLGPAGQYYAALVTYAFIAQKPVTGAWHPSSLSPAAAKQLQSFVSAFLKSRSTAAPLDLAGCRDVMTSRFCDAWNGYVPDQWASPQPNCKAFFARPELVLSDKDIPNPFAFDAAADGAYWFPSP
jgi:hypothetical protein